MTELDIGRHCSFPSCHQLDFLPFQCDLCSHIFCKSHKEVTSHQCTGKVSGIHTHGEAPERGNIPTYRCTYEDCCNYELVSVRCSLCDEQFCLKHRSAEEHQCDKLPAAQANNCIRNVSNPVTKPTYIVPRDIKYKNKKSEKLATKVALMKLKMSATGRDDIPTDHRVYFFIYKSLDSSKHPIYVSKLWTVGRMLDVVADATKTVNKNDVDNQPHLWLFSATTGGALSNSETIEDLLENETIYNGSTVVLGYDQ